MKLDQLERGFFGFKKAAVYEYISRTEEEFAAKLADKSEEQRSAETQYQERIAALEAELRETREQLEAQRSQQMAIAATMMDATRCAETLRREAGERARREREEWESELEAKQRELERFGSRVQKLRSVFDELIRGMDEQAQGFARRIEDVQAACPERNMSLFERRDGSDEQE